MPDCGLIATEAGIYGWEFGSVALFGSFGWLVDVLAPPPIPGAPDAGVLGVGFPGLKLYACRNRCISVVHTGEGAEPIGQDCACKEPF